METPSDHEPEKRAAPPPDRDGSEHGMNGTRDVGNNGLPAPSEKTVPAAGPDEGMGADQAGHDKNGGASAADQPTRAYKIWTADKNGELIDPPDDDNPDPDPNNEKAEQIYFGIRGQPQPTVQQLQLQLNIDKVLRACRYLYLKKDDKHREKFRIYYVRLFRLAQLGLEMNTLPEVANAVLDAVTSDLVEDEAAILKNGHLMKLGRYVCLYSIIPLVIYIVVKLFPVKFITANLGLLYVDPNFLAAFSILWVGCFIGVWLSYGIRKVKFSLSDLTLSDADYLAPHIRLIFAGLLTMIIGILFALNIIGVQIGSVWLTNITSRPMLAFLVGLFCGISESALPASVGSRAETFINNIK